MQQWSNQDYEQLASLLDDVDGIVTVLASRMDLGDALSARYICKRWLGAVRHAVHAINLAPHHLVGDPVPQATAAGLQAQLGSTRPRRAAAASAAAAIAASAVVPLPRRLLPACMHAYPDLQRLSTAFPGLRKATIRVMHRKGLRGVGINTDQSRLQQLFAAFQAIPTLKDLSIELDIDVPRARHREAYEAAVGLCATAFKSIGRLASRLQTLRLVWYEVRLAQQQEMTDMLACLRTGLKRLELPRTPGSLLPALSQLSGLTCLKIGKVGEDLHMEDTGLARHTEVRQLSSLQQLHELHIDGWCDPTSLHAALGALPQLRVLQLGEEIPQADALPLDTLKQLQALTVSGVLNPLEPLLLTRLVKLEAAGSCQCPIFGVAPEAPAAASAAAAGGGLGPSSGSSSCSSSICAPNLKELNLHLISEPPQLGPHLCCLTKLRFRLHTGTCDELSAVPGMLEACAAALDALPQMQDLLIETRRELQPALLLGRCPQLAAAISGMSCLKALHLIRAWDGLVPPSWDYANTAHSFAAHFELADCADVSWTFLKHLPCLQHLHLHASKLDISQLPPSLTSLAVEGIVHVTNNAQLETDQKWPQLRSLFVLLATDKALHSALNDGVRATSRAGGCLNRQDAAEAPAGSSDGSLAAAEPAAKRQRRGQQQHQQQQRQTQHHARDGSDSTTSRGTSNREAQPCSASGGCSTVSNGCSSVLDLLSPMLGPQLTSLCFSATPGMQADSQPALLQRSTAGADDGGAVNNNSGNGQGAQHSLPLQLQQQQLSGASDYGVSALLQLTGLQQLQMWVLPMRAQVIECSALTGLASLPRLRSLSFDNPITGATRLLGLTQLSVLTQLTELVTGSLGAAAAGPYSGRLVVHGMSPAQRLQALEWLSDAVHERFGSPEEEAEAAAAFAAATAAAAAAGPPVRLA